MKFDKKLNYYLRDAHVDFMAFEILEVIPQKNDHAVVFLAPRTMGTNSNFCVQYMDNHNYYGSLEKMLEVSVAYERITDKDAERIKKDYYARKGEN